MGFNPTRALFRVGLSVLAIGAILGLVGLGFDYRSTHQPPAPPCEAYFCGLGPGFDDAMRAASLYEAAAWVATLGAVLAVLGFLARRQERRAAAASGPAGPEPTGPGRLV